MNFFSCIRFPVQIESFHSKHRNNVAKHMRIWTRFLCSSGDCSNIIFRHHILMDVAFFLKKKTCICLGMTVVWDFNILTSCDITPEKWTNCSVLFMIARKEFILSIMIRPSNMHEPFNGKHLLCRTHNCDKRKHVVFVCLAKLFFISGFFISWAYHCVVFFCSLQNWIVITSGIDIFSLARLFFCVLLCRFFVFLIFERYIRSSTVYKCHACNAAGTSITKGIAKFTEKKQHRFSKRFRFACEKFEAINFKHLL